ncbi:MAG: hypothetical protein LBS03_00430 [Bacteroidales bacterium]|jgi:hypothetical protein|nr:hypothetical protein [Bacteroidales bacterium]
MSRQIIRLSLLPVLSAVMSLVVSCDETPDFIDPVRAVRLIPESNGMIVTWRNPQSPILEYVEVSYIDLSGAPQSIQQRKFIGDPSSGFSTAYTRFEIRDISEYEFTLVACSSTGLRSEPVKASAAPIESALGQLLKSIKIYQPVDAGNIIRVTWDASIGSDLFVSVAYPKSGVTETVTFASDATEGDIADADITPAPEITVWTHDSKGDESRKTSLLLSAEIKLPSSAFRILDETPYWTEYTKSTLLFDGLIGAPWHTDADAVHPYPHFVMVALDRMYELTRYALYPRTDEISRPHTNHRVLLSLENSTDEKFWTDTGIFNFAQEIEDRGGIRAYFDAWHENPPRELPWFVYPFTGYSYARYFRLEILAGANPWSMLDEMAVYGIPVVE